MRFYRMQSPQYLSDQEDLSTNGNLEYHYRLPGVSCQACKATHGGSRVLAHAATQEMIDDPRFRSRWPITDAEHLGMQQEVAGYLDMGFEAFDTFRPGDMFQPAYYDNPAPPTADFLWPNIRSFVVSERMKQLVFNDLQGDVEIVPVQPRKIGNGTANGSGQPGSESGAMKPYYQILVRSESDYPKGGAPVSVCPVCKHEKIDDTQRELAMHEGMWRGRPIFLLRTTLYVIVTEPLADLIRETQATNVDFVPI